MGRRSRRRERRFAERWGFFWLPCPLCNKEFGGHEWKDLGGLSSCIPGAEPGTCQGICPDCTRAGKGSRDFYLLPEETA